MRASLSLLPFLLATLLAGCATAPPYSAPLPPPLQEEDYATVRVDSGTMGGALLAASSSNIYIEQVDDASVDSCRRRYFNDPARCLPQLARLAPGRHSLKLSWRRMNFFHRARLEITLERGGYYVVRHEDDGKVGRFWVERDEVVLGPPVAVWSSPYQPAGATPKPPAAVPRGVEAFEAICLKQLPDFAGAAEAARHFGFTELKDVGFMKYGLLPDSSLSVQIQGTRMCTVTTPAAAEDPGTAFLARVHAYRDAGTGNEGERRVRIGGRHYHVNHDRKDGEAFILRRD
jgi:hypothetical protein